MSKEAQCAARRVLRGVGCCVGVSVYSVFYSISGVLPAKAAALPAEPEDTNFVRTCPGFGKGYFYIPGTQTCLYIGGYVSSTMDGGDNVYARQVGDYQRKTYTWGSRGQLYFSTAQATELGVLRSHMTLRSDWWGGAEMGSANEVSKGSLRQGYIELGGLRIGLDTSAFADWIPYSSGVGNDDIINGANTRTNTFSYTYAADNGFSAIIALEQGNNFDGDKNPRSGLFEPGLDAQDPLQNRDKGGYRWANGAWHFRKLSQQQHNYAPYIALGAKYQRSWGGLAAIIGYDSYYSEYAVKARADVNLTQRLSVFAMAAYKSMNDYYNLDTSYGKNGKKIIAKNGYDVEQRGIYRQINSMYGDWGGHWAFYGGGTYAFSPKFKTNWQTAYSSNRVLAVSANLEKHLVPGLIVQPELNFVHFGDRYGRHASLTSDNAPAEYRTSLKGKRALQGELYVKRSF